MLKLTANAVATLTASRANSGTPDTFGVRFFTSSTPSSDRPRLAMEFVALPEPGDASLQEHGLNVHVAPEVNQIIGEATVDVETVDGQSQLVMRRQQDAAG